MKIDRISIENFGRFQHKELTFPDGLVVVYGLNEEGKSTILDFILLMLYGFKGMKKDARENPRHRYINNTALLPRGVMYLSDETVHYRLERRFGSTNGRDEISLINDDTQESIPLGLEETPGDYLFHCDIEAFLRTYFIYSQGASFAADRKTDSLSQRLENLQETGSEDQSYLAATLLLQKQREALVSKSGKKGDLVEKLQVLENKRIEYFRALEIEQEKLRDSQMIQHLVDDYNAFVDWANEKNQRDLANEGGDARDEKVKPVFNGLFIIFALISFAFGIYQIIQGEILYFTVLVVLSLAFLFVGPLLFKPRHTDIPIEDFPEARERKIQLQMEIVEAKTRVREKYRDEPFADFIKMEMKTLQEEVDVLEEELAAIDMAISHLKSLAGERAQEYLPLLNQKTEKILHEVIDRPESHIRINNQLDVAIEKEDNIWSSDYLSSSTREQAYFAMRMALIQLLEDRQATILLDDPFVFYDDERAAAAFFYLERLSIQDDRQILLFTCQSRFINWTKQSEDIHLMRLDNKG